MVVEFKLDLESCCGSSGFLGVRDTSDAAAVGVLDMLLEFSAPSSSNPSISLGGFELSLITPSRKSYKSLAFR